MVVEKGSVSILGMILSGDKEYQKEFMRHTGKHNREAAHVF